MKALAIPVAMKKVHFKDMCSGIVVKPTERVNLVQNALSVKASTSRRKRNQKEL